MFKRHFTKSRVFAALGAVAFLALLVAFLRNPTAAHLEKHRRMEAELMIWQRIYTPFGRNKHKQRHFFLAVEDDDSISELHILDTGIFRISVEQPFFPRIHDHCQKT